MKYLCEFLTISAITFLFRFAFDAPLWGSLIGGYVFWLYIQPKGWR